jgi:hypothetical protein
MDLMEYQTVRLIYKEEKRLKAFFRNNVLRGRRKSGSVASLS